MRTQFYQKLSTIHLAVIDLVEWNYFGPAYIISRVNVPKEHRGKGVARQLMSQVLKEADETQTNLILEINPSGGLSRVQLRAWYQRCGFKETKTKGLYRRKPNTPESQV